MTPDFDFALGETADMIRESTRRFAADRIAPLAARIDAEDWFPRDELWPAMGELGLHGITVPEEDEPAPGTPVVLSAPAQRVLLYDKESGELIAREPAAVG